MIGCRSYRSQFEKSFVILFPLWLLALMWVPTTSYHDKKLMQLFVLLTMLAVAFVYAREYFVYGLIYRQSPSIRLWSALVITTFTLSALFSSDTATSLAYVGVTVIGLMCCSGLWFCLRNQIIQCLTVYAVVGSVILVIRYFNAAAYQTRLSLSSSDPPNYLGLVAYSVLVSCLAIRSRVIAYTLVCMNFLVIIATQGRGALLAGVLAVLVHIILTQTSRRGFRGAFLLCGGAVLAVVIALTFKDHITEAVSSLLFINDRFRGVGTGFTGRFDAWREALELFRLNPIFGVGFRQHEQYMITLSSTHNGYLSVLAETGALGTICLLVLIYKCTKRLFLEAMAGSPIAILGLSFVGGYLFIAIFERFLLNVGNPTSMLAWLFLLMPRAPNGKGAVVNSRQDVNVLAVAPVVLQSTP